MKSNFKKTDRKTRNSKNQQKLQKNQQKTTKKNATTPKNLAATMISTTIRTILDGALPN